MLVVAAVVVRDGHVLLARRPPGKHLAGSWEFPGGKVDTGETPEQALARELREELNVAVTSPQPLTFVYHRYPERTVLILFYRCDIAGQPHPAEGNPVAWAPLADLDRWQLPPADRDLVRLLQQGIG